MSKDDDSPEERARVYARIAPLILDFANDNADCEFHAEDLRQHVLDNAPEIAPASPDRILRQLRLEGKLDYTVINRSLSLYRFHKGTPIPMNAHSHILGGSNAARLLACPASYAEQMKSPIVDVESAYAAEGTALHQAIAHCMESKVKPKHILGAQFYNHDIDEARVAVLQTALVSMEELLARYGNPKSFRVIGLEETLPLPGVTGSFGSVDLVMADKRTVVIVDWKFGQGVPVRALYTDDDGGEYLNPQLAFYAAAARDRHPRQFKDKKIVAAIIQPRLDPPYSFTETTDAELDDFIESFVNAFSEALGRDAYRERGEHCRFAPCKATCPLWTGPAIDLAAIDPARAAMRQSAEPDPTEYGGYLSRALTLVELAETWAEEIRKQGHLFLEAGGRVPGWKLVPKRGTRRWIDENAAPAQLAQMGGHVSDIYSEPSLRSVAQVEKALKSRGIALPDDMYQSISSGTTIAHEDDRRPDVSRDMITDEFRQALKELHRASPALSPPDAGTP